MLPMHCARSTGLLRPFLNAGDPERPAPASLAAQSHRRHCSHCHRPARAQLLAQVNHACHVVPSWPKRRSFCPPEGRDCSTPANPSVHRRRKPSPAGEHRRSRARSRSGPSDPRSKRRIRSRSDRVRAVRSRSNSLDPRVPLRPGRLDKEPLGFLRINPQSALVQK